MTGLGTTFRQNETLAFLRTYRMRNGTYPTFIEIADGLGVKSKSSVKRLLDGLERRGYIRREAHLERAIEIIDRNAPPASPDVPFLPLRLKAQLDAFCAERDEKPNDVISDAVALHLDFFASGGEKAQPDDRDARVAAANKIIAEQSSVIATAVSALREAEAVLAKCPAKTSVVTAIAMIEGRS